MDDQRVPLEPGPGKGDATLAELTRSLARPSRFTFSLGDVVTRAGDRRGGTVMGMSSDPLRESKWGHPPLSRQDRPQIPD
jgi:hypothetical protein